MCIIFYGSIEAKILKRSNLDEQKDVRFTSAGFVIPVILFLAPETGCVGNVIRSRSRSRNLDKLLE